jgi:beta-lactamase superfamily II metal-dependent hydrolase
MKKIPVEYELRGKSFSWEGVEGEFLWPEVVPEEVAPSAKNNDSLVLRLHYGSRSLLLPGDAEKQVEQELLTENSAGSLRADALKVGHHGSKNSTTPEFLAAMHPRVAIISSGEENPFSHPSPETREKLERAGVRILRTDRDGAVHVLTDGTGLESHLFLGLSGVGRRDCFSASELAKLQTRRREEVGNQGPLAIRDSFCTAQKKTNLRIRPTS